MFDYARQPLREPAPKGNTKSESIDYFEALKQDRKAQQRLERAYSSWRRLPFKIGATVLAGLTLVGYWRDVQDNRTITNEAVISLEQIAPAQDPANDNKATIVIDGFNAYDANYLTATLGPSFQSTADGELWSLNYNNAVLNRDQIFEEIVELVEDNDIESVSLVGYSMGGIIATEAAADLVSKTDIPVNTLSLIETPSGYDGLRDYQRRELGFAQAIANFPGSEYSSWFRSAGEMYFYRDAYTKGNTLENIGNFFSTFNTVLAEASNPRKTSMQLLIQQVHKIAKVDFAQEFRTIAEQASNKQITVVNYFKTSAYDTVVDDGFSADQTGSDAKESHIPFSSYTVQGAQHSLYFQSVPAFEASFQEASRPTQEAVDTQIAIAGLRKNLSIGRQGFLRR